MSEWEQEYIDAYREGGAGAVYKLLIRKFPDDQARIRELDRLDQTGNWDIEWHRSSMHGDGRRDAGIVRRYLGD